MTFELLKRFKFEFSHCKTYNDLILTCTKVIDEIEELRELGAEYDNQSSTDDYHFFRIDETDKRKIKKLKRLGFIKYDIND
jgi:hypothetical protein|tara:strand:+ start:172 stop:414 length:243 start_codon:yes stop_codon:yes gene_type:complete